MGEKGGALQVCELQRSECEMRDSDDDNGYMSAPEDDGLDLGSSILISCLDKDKSHPVVRKVILSHRKVLRCRQVPDFSTWVVKFRRNSEDAVNKAIARAQEPMEGRHELTTYSPTMVMKCGNLYKDTDNGFVVIFTGEVTPALIYITLGLAEIVPVGRQALYVVVPPPFLGAPEIYKNGKIDLDLVASALAVANETAVAQRTPPPLWAVMKDFSSEYRWLIREDPANPSPPPGGGFVYISGWDLFFDDESLELLMKQLGAVRGSEAKWCQRTNVKEKHHFLRICVRQEYTGDGLGLSHDAVIYRPKLKDRFTIVQDQEGASHNEPGGPSAYVLQGSMLKLCQTLVKQTTPLLDSTRAAKARALANGRPAPGTPQSVVDAPQPSPKTAGLDSPRTPAASPGPTPPHSGNPPSYGPTPESSPPQSPAEPGNADGEEWTTINRKLNYPQEGRASSTKGKGQAQGSPGHKGGKGSGGGRDKDSAPHGDVDLQGLAGGAHDGKQDDNGPASAKQSSSKTHPMKWPADAATYNGYDWELQMMHDTWVARQAEEPQTYMDDPNNLFLEGQPCGPPPPPPHCQVICYSRILRRFPPKETADKKVTKTVLKAALRTMVHPRTLGELHFKELDRLRHWREYSKPNPLAKPAHEWLDNRLLEYAADGQKLKGGSPGANPLMSTTTGITPTAANEPNCNGQSDGHESKTDLRPTAAQKQTTSTPKKAGKGGTSQDAAGGPKGRDEATATPTVKASASQRSSTGQGQAGGGGAASIVSPDYNESSSEDQQDAGEQELEALAEVEKIVEKRGKGESTLYRLRWKGHDRRADEWRSHAQLDCPALLKAFELQQKDRRTASSDEDSQDSYNGKKTKKTKKPSKHGRKASGSSRKNTEASRGMMGLSTFFPAIGQNTGGKNDLKDTGAGNGGSPVHANKKGQSGSPNRARHSSTSSRQTTASAKPPAEQPSGRRWPKASSRTVALSVEGSLAAGSPGSGNDRRSRRHRPRSVIESVLSSDNESAPDEADSTASSSDAHAWRSRDHSRSPKQRTSSNTANNTPTGASRS